MRSEVGGLRSKKERAGRQHHKRSTINQFSHAAGRPCPARVRRGEVLRDHRLDPTQQIIAEEVLKEIRGRLGFLLRWAGLPLERSAPTLSGGESQRIRLAGQIGCGLVGVLYILDEPSIGLHPR
ncbi:MAG: hypothetical protein U0992_11895 [Planctomycetaceae bacterium]